MTDLETPRRALAALDLTNLNDDCAPEAVEALCARAIGPHGAVAAVCVWPRFVAQCKQALTGTPVRVATVTNFPGGLDSPTIAAQDVALTAADGVDEIDVVLDYQAFQKGEFGRSVAREALEAMRGACPVTLKVILETGELKDTDAIAAASDMALEIGADFLKTSTGKVPGGATLDAARAMLERIHASGRPAGLKVSGGVRTLADAAAYLALADEIMGPDWATPDRFRIGASGLLDVLEATISDA